MSASHIQPDNLLSFLQRNEHPAIYRLVIAEITQFRARNRDVVGQWGLLAVVAQGQVEGSTVSTSRSQGLKTVESLFEHIDGVFHPFSSHGLTQSVAITGIHDIDTATVRTVALGIASVAVVGVMIHNTLLTSVEILTLHGPWKFATPLMDSTS